MSIYLSTYPSIRLPNYMRTHFESKHILSPPPFPCLYLQDPKPPTYLSAINLLVNPFEPRSLPPHSRTLRINEPRSIPLHVSQSFMLPFKPPVRTSVFSDFSSWDFLFSFYFEDDPIRFLSIGGRKKESKSFTQSLPVEISNSRRHWDALLL